MNEEFQRLYHLASAHITHPFRHSKEHWQHTFEHTAALNRYFTIMVVTVLVVNMFIRIHVSLALALKILLFHTPKLAFAVHFA